jgi:hypothetical protein
MKKIFFLLPIIASAFFSGCNNDIDINEQWKEIPVIFGLLDQSDSVQYIKINKAFLGKANALVMASNYDTVNYGNVLDVKIKEVSNNVVINTFTLQQDSGIAKDPGVFAYPEQVLFKLAGHTLDPNNEYELSVTNLQSGLVCTAKTNLVSDFSVSSPFPNLQLNFTVPDAAFHIQWTSAVNGRRYNVIMRFWYTETNKITGLVRERHVDMNFLDQRASTIAGGEVVDVNFLSKAFYSFLRSNIQVNDSLWRHVGKLGNPNAQLDFIITAANEEFSTYMEVNEPSTGPLQEKPYYTNINNGIGLFAARYVQKNPYLYNRRLTGPSIDSIYGGHYTYNLGFCSTNMASPYACF